MIEKEYPSVFDVPVKGIDGEENFLDKFRGNVLIFVNTTGHCGNAQQWPILDRFQKEYYDRGVRVIYIPTNDYCVSVTYGAHKYGIQNAKDSYEYAKGEYGVDGIFTELLSSRYIPWEETTFQWQSGQNIDIDYYSKGKWLVQSNDMLSEQKPRDPLFRYLIPEKTEEPISGNFHKYITNKAGMPVAHLHCGFLLNGHFDLLYADDLEDENLITKKEITVSEETTVEELIKLEYNATEKEMDLMFPYIPQHYTKEGSNWVSILREGQNMTRANKEDVLTPGDKVYVRFFKDPEQYFIDLQEKGVYREWEYQRLCTLIDEVLETGKTTLKGHVYNPYNY